MGQLVSKASLDQQKAENQQLQDQLLRSEAELEAKSVVVIGLEADLQIKKNGKEEVRKNQRRVRMEQLWLYAQRKAQERIYQRMSYDFVLQLNVEDLERLCQTNSLPVITGLRWNNQRFFGRSIGVLGTYNVGKTFFLNLFAQLESGEEMLSGFDVHTQGLSARCVEIFDNPFILFDSAGIRSPAEVPEASDDKTVKRIFRLHKQRERAITSMVAALSDFVCLLVGELTWSDQEELVRYCQARWDARQQRPEGYLWVVHNMRHIKRVQELLHAQELIKRHFPDGQQRTFNEDGLSVWWYQSFGLTPARHVLLMDHTSDIGKAHNTGVLKMLRGWAQSLNASGPNHSKDIQPAQFTKLILDTMAQHMKGSIIRNLEGFELVAAQPELVPAAEPVSLHTYNAATAKTVTIHPQVNMPGLKAALGVALNLPPGDIRSIATADGPLDTDDQVAALQKNTYLIVDLENQPVNRASKQMTLNVHSPNLETRSLKILPPTLAEFKTLLSVLFGAAVVSVWTLDGEEQVQVSPDRPPGERPERCPYSKMKDGDYVVLEYDFGKHAPSNYNLVALTKGALSVLKVSDMVVEQPIDQLFRPILTATDETYPEDKRPEGSRPECYQVQLTVPGVSLDDVAMMRGQSAQHISITATKKPAGFYGHSEAAKAVQNLEVSVLLPERFDTCLDRVDPFEFVDRSLADGLLTLAFPTSRSVSKLENRAIPLALPRGFPKELGHLAPAKLKELQASLVKLITEHKAKEAQAAPQQPPALADFQSENVIERLDWERALQRVVTQLNANAAPPAQPD